jgi:adenosine deaminase
MKFRLTMIIVLILTTTACSHIGLKSNLDPNNSSKTELLYNKSIEGESPNIAQLNLFFSMMPKGGDLHHHYSGKHLR